MELTPFNLGIAMSGGVVVVGYVASGLNLGATIVVGGVAD